MKKILPLFLLFILAGAGCAANKPAVSNQASKVVPAADLQEPTKRVALEIDQDGNVLNVIPKDASGNKPMSPTILPADQIQGKQIRLTTPKGEIVFDLFADTAPLTVSNFVNLAGAGFYDGLTFHRRVEGFVIQGGDPNGNGSGGSGYTVDAEIVPELRHEAYVIATARLADQVNPTRASSGSQFYITLAAAPFLDGAYTVFGRVIDGTDVVDAILVGDEIVTVEIR